MNIWNNILDLVFPAKCLVCHTIGADLCLSCLHSSPQAERETADWIFPLFDYRHPPIKRAIWLLKYKGKKRLAHVFARAMYERILEEVADLKIMENFNEPILIPIPLSPKRHRARGFNQSIIICKYIVKINKGSFKLEKKVLIKPKDTKHQAEIKNRKERLENLIDSFQVKNKERVAGKNIILIDDVTTTGATLKEAKKVLKQAGARKVIAFTIAH